jgi:hypothetical protein
VAAAADAWLADPQDAGVYGRLVGAIRDRRAYLNPKLDETPYDPEAAAPPGAGTPREVEPIVVTPTHTQPDEVLDELAEHHPVQPLGAALRGADPREVLDRLRGVRPDAGEQT